MKRNDQVLGLVAEIPSAQYRAKALITLYQQFPEQRGLLSGTRKEILRQLQDLNLRQRNTLLRFMTDNACLMSTYFQKNF